MPEDPPDRDRSSTPLERVVRIFTGDPALGPVLVVLVLIGGTFVAGAVVLALGNRNLFALAGLAGLALLTLLAVDNEIRTARRMTAGVWAIASVWLAAGAIGGLFVWIGAF